MQEPNPATAPPAGGTADADPRRWWTLGVLCLSLVLVVAAVSGLNVALPTLVEQLDASASELQWIVDIYALVFAGLLLPAGALGDRFGRKGALQFGLVVFIGASLLAANASSADQVIITRGLMGVGAAFVMPATLSIITNVFPPQERGRAIAIWAGFAGAGGAIGPVASGILLDHYWWGSVFFVNVPIALLALALGAYLVPTSRDEQHRRLDPVGALLSVVALASLLYGIIEGPEVGWTDEVTLGALFVAAVASLAFVLWERRNEHPMLDLAYFRDPRFSVSAITIGLGFFAMFGLFFLLTQYLQFVKGYSALEAALRTLPIAFMLIIVSPRSAALAERFGPKRVMATGLLVLASGFVVMSFARPSSNYLLVAVALVLMGSGMAVTMANATGGIMGSLPLGKAGVGSAVNDTTREVGGSIGIAVLGSLLSVGYRSSIDADLGSLPPGAADAARDSVGAALGVAEGVGGPVGAQLADAARSAFTDAYSIAMLVAGAAALIGAAIVGRYLPSTRAAGLLGEPSIDVDTDTPPRGDEVPTG